MWVILGLTSQIVLILEKFKSVLDRDGTLDNMPSSICQETRDHKNWLAHWVQRLKHSQPDLSRPPPPKLLYYSPFSTFSLPNPANPIGNRMQFQLFSVYRQKKISSSSSTVSACFASPRCSLFQSIHKMWIQRLLRMHLQGLEMVEIVT